MYRHIGDIWSCQQSRDQKVSNGGFLRFCVPQNGSRLFGSERQRDVDPRALWCREQAEVARTEIR